MIHTRVITLGCVSNARRTKAFSKKEDTSPHYTIPMVIAIVHLIFKNINSNFTFFSFFCKNYIFFWLVCAKGQKKILAIRRISEQFVNLLTVCLIKWLIYCFFCTNNRHFGKLLLIICLLKIKTQHIVIIYFYKQYIDKKEKGRKSCL